MHVNWLRGVFEQEQELQLLLIVYLNFSRKSANHMENFGFRIYPKQMKEN